MALFHVYLTIHFLSFRLIPILLIHFAELATVSHSFHANPTAKFPFITWVYAFAVIPFLGVLFCGAAFLREKTVCFILYQIFHALGFAICWMGVVQVETGLDRANHMMALGSFFTALWGSTLMFRIATGLSTRQLLRTWAQPGYHAPAMLSAQQAENDQPRQPQRQGIQSFDSLFQLLFDPCIQTPKTGHAYELDHLLEPGTTKVV